MFSTSYGSFAKRTYIRVAIGFVFSKLQHALICSTKRYSSMKRKLVVAAIAALFAASPAFPADDSAVNGSVDAGEGTELQTTISPSDVHLENGVDLRLATRSTGTVFGDHVLLRDGALRVSHFDSYAIHVRQLEIEADSAGTEAVVRVKGKTIEVASIGGAVNVADKDGLLARVASGTKMSFQSTGADPGQSGATAAQTGAAPAEKGPISDKKAILWAAGACAVAAIIIGSIAAAQGKSPF